MDYMRLISSICKYIHSPIYIISKLNRSNLLTSFPLQYEFFFTQIILDLRLSCLQRLHTPYIHIPT